MKQSLRGVVITGCGVVSPFGRGLSRFWEGLLAARSAFAPIRNFPAGDLTPDVAAEVADVASGDPDRAGAFAVAAAEEALARAGLDARSLAARRLGVALGSTLGGMQLFERWDLALAAGGPVPRGLESVPYYGPSVRLARHVGCQGPVATPQLACASGTYALALARDWIRAGRADVVLAGGADLLCRFLVAGFNSLRATAEVARPFDRSRTGLVLGEGAAVLVLEGAEHAARRGVVPWARLLGCGAAADAVHMTAPDREGNGAARAMRAALRDAGVAAERVDFVSAHGTATPYNDAMEAAALLRVFGERRVPIHSVKGAIGHTLGAAGAFDAVTCVEAIRSGTIPPTAGLVELDPAFGGLDVVQGGARTQRVEVALSTSSGFAGANAACVVARA